MTASRLLVVAAALLLGGCSGVRERVRGWMDDTPPPASRATTRPATYYAAGALPVHATPSDASKVVGRLAPNARVTRTQIERGWARIKSDDVEGWVDATQLLRRPATGQPPSSAPASPPASDAAPPPAADATETAIDAPDAATPPAAVVADPPPAPTPDPEPVAAPPPAPRPRPKPPVEDPF